jgi:hypothetical protein
MTAPSIVPPLDEQRRFSAGDRVTWRGVCGFNRPVEATIIAVHRTRVTVRVKRRNGVVVDRRVSPSSLRERKPAGVS